MIKLTRVLKPLQSIRSNARMPTVYRGNAHVFPQMRMKSDDSKQQDFNQESHESITDKIEREHSVDESELFADRLNSKVYYAKRDHPDLAQTKEILKQRQQAWDNAELANTAGVKMLSEQEQMDRIEKMTRLNSLFQGLAVLVVALGAAYYLSSNKSILFKLTKDPIDEEKLDKKISTGIGKNQKKLKKNSTDLNLETIKLETAISTMQFDELVQWKDGKTNVLPLFANKKTGGAKKVCEIIECGDSLYYINQRGDLYKYDDKESSKSAPETLILSDQKLVQLKSTSSEIFGKNSDGEILIIPLQDSQYLQHVETKRSRIMPWKHYQKYTNKLPMLFEDYDLGVNHFVGINLKDHMVYTCAVKSNNNNNNNNNVIEHRGQFGLPEYAPVNTQKNEMVPHLPLLELKNVELLNYYVKNDKLIERSFQRVSCGKFHTLAMDNGHDVFSFGNNTFGQLGFPVTYETENISYPKKLGKFPQLNRDQTFDWSVQDIKCGDYTSYFKIRDDNTEKYTYFSLGNGFDGQLGNSLFKNTQQSPTKIKYDLYDSIKSWQFHDTQCLLVNSGNKLFVWGHNAHNDLPGLLSNKKCAYPLDTNIKLRDESRILVTNNYGTIIY